ncbi:hypothetical protein DLE01_08060 [Streptomyces sp. FT05W]|uniref:hypothetical protein n=1 Tax=unclassified Streptomyces TaxID=2593676 RepID=UPI000978FBA1|nr:MULTISPECIES: hypothetical protein [unclassified Streptomyces]ONI50885.1 hypothetical protein STIB_46840 [Streptomyces sp. IB2014 011-1]PWS52015.1 hypothetical protein DLE01_08060 [Streptomyces sp. FT05W]RDV49080.1 hypothetical protein DDV98_25355 [Streptomyces sp. IB2014 011-12]RUP64087.1 hypothetical protein SSPNP10_31205 [Streptomyces sp. NP10]
MFNRDLGGTALVPAHLLRTVARGTDSCKEPLFVGAFVLACIINGDSLTSVLRQATWFIVALIVLILVQVIASRFVEGSTWAVAGLHARAVE